MNCKGLSTNEDDRLVSYFSAIFFLSFSATPVLFLKFVLPLVTSCVQDDIRTHFEKGIGIISKVTIKKSY